LEPTDTQLDEALEYSRVLSEVEREIAAAFTGHFAGKPGMYVPATRYDGIRIRAVSEVGEKATDAIESVHDYADVLAVFHAVIRGQRPIADYQHAVIRRYLDLHAADVAELRSGLDAPLSYVAPSIPAFLQVAV
jgi:hypothetical protein